MINPLGNDVKELFRDKVSGRQKSVGSKQYAEVKAKGRNKRQTNIIRLKDY
jgi:hypothetical protein